MMEQYFSFLKIGWSHIIDLNAYDHLLFVMTLCATFKVAQWKQILVIITAFTIGHCATLVLSSFDFIPSNSHLTDRLIPITIMITALGNVLTISKSNKIHELRIKYGIALIFGLVHGLAFASNFKGMMFDGNIIMPLFAFNLGIELGQIVVVLLFMITLYFYTKLFNGEHGKWNLFISGAGFGIAATLLLNTLSNS